MTEWPVRFGIVAALVAALAACAGKPAGPLPGEAPVAVGHADVDDRARLARGASVFSVDTGRSLAIVEVRRAGVLARFGHDHVVSSRDISGFVAPDEGRADLSVPLGSLVVDDPALRAEAGFETTPSAEDVAGTRRNMLDKVLEADRYPVVLVAVRGLGVGGDARPLRAEITLHGTTAPVDVDAEVDRSADEIAVHGSFSLDQSRFGIVPFSILGGALAVQDRLAIRFRIHARRMPVGDTRSR